MKNYIQKGDALDMTGPAGGLQSGQGHLFGDLFGVAAVDIPEGTLGTVQVEGVYTLPKAAGEAIGQGAFAYWTGAAISGTAAGNTKIGHVTEAAASAAATVRVRLLS